VIAELIGLQTNEMRIRVIRQCDLGPELEPAHIATQNLGNRALATAHYRPNSSAR